MKKIINIFCIAFLMGFNISHAQNACEIYKLVIDSTYSKYATRIVNINGLPIDPTQVAIDTPVVYEKVSFDYFVEVYNNLEFNQYSLNNWFMKRIDYTGLKNQKFQTDTITDRWNIKSCWNPKEKPYNILFRRTMEEISAYDTLYGNGDKNIAKNTMKIFLSSIMYSSDKKTALLYLECYIRSNIVHKFMWAYILKKEGRKWKIKKNVGWYD